MDAAGGEIGIGEVVGENVGVGVNYAEQIIDGVGNDFGAGRRMGGVFAEIRSDIRMPSKMRLRLCVGSERADGVMNGLGGEIVKGKAAGRAGVKSLGSKINEILSGRIKEGEDRKRWKLRAEFVDGVQRVEIRSVKIKGQGVPRANR